VRAVFVVHRASDRQGGEKMPVITRRHFLKVSGTTLAATALMGSKVAGQTSPQPNFVFILADDMRYDDLAYSTLQR
jgi:hypothetical protein